MELRIYKNEALEIRSSEGEPSVVSGFGVIYDREIELFPGYMEKIRAGSLRKSINSGSEIKSFFNHDSGYVLATTKSNPPLAIMDTDKGLRFEAPIPPTSYGKDLEINLERKNVKGASFAFTIDKDGDILTRDEKGVYHREVISAQLFEVGPVTNPAYPQAKVGLRSFDDIRADAELRCHTEEKEEDNTHEINCDFITITEGGY